MSLELNEAIDYSRKVASHPTYRISRLIPLTNSAVTLGSSTTESQIEVPQTVFNLSSSTLDFNMNVAAAAASHASNLNTLGAQMIDSIELRARTGPPLARINNLDMYTRCVLPYVTKIEEFKTYDSTLGADTEANADVKDRGSNFFPSNAALSTTVTALVPSGVRIRGSTANPSVLVTPVTTANRAYTEPQYFKQGTAATAVNCNFSIPLRQLMPHTIASMNRDMYFGQQLLVVITWNPIAKLGWDSATIDPAAASPVNLTGAVTLSNLRLSLQVEQNQDIREQLVNRVLSQGISMRVPYVQSYIYTSASGSSSSHQQRFNSSNGDRLLCIYSAVANSFAYGAFNPDIANTGLAAAKKVLSFRPSLNSVPLTENRIDETKKEGYQQMFPLVKGSVIQSSDQYDFNRVYIQSFREGPCCEWLENDDVEDGIDLNVEQDFVMDYTTNATANPYREFMFAVTQKNLSIMPHIISLQ